MFAVPFPATYLLVLRLSQCTTVAIGKLGERTLAAGYYTYVGSARRNAQWRLLRHMSGSVAKKRWHIDYLRAVADCVAVYVFDQRRIGECQLAKEIGSIPGVEVPIARFGASDCHCPAHLFFHGDQQPTPRLSVEPAITLHQQEIIALSAK